MKPKDVAHVSDAYINRLDLSKYMTSENVHKIRIAYSNIEISYSFNKIKELALPQKSGNAKRPLWFYLVKNGFVEYPPKNHCQVLQANPKDKDTRLKGIYVRRCKCGKRPFADRCVGYSWWIYCADCGIQGAKSDDLEGAIENWNENDISYSTSE